MAEKDNPNNKENKDEEEETEEINAEDINALVNMLKKANLSAEKSSGADKPAVPKVLSETTLKGVAEYIKSGKCKNIIVMSGAGVSVAAGIPDFRTPGTGLYSNLQKYNLPRPEAVFEINYFRSNPKPFCLLTKELFPGTYKPTAAHHFVRLLNEKGLLLRNYTQNIDTLERVANVPPEVLVEAHGSFGVSHCIDCKKEFPFEFVRDKVFADDIPRCDKCNGLVKPDIVFFGESLPRRFFELMSQDFPKCDLLIVIGTSLNVQPFASLIDKVSSTCPRLLINMEEVGTASGSSDMDLLLMYLGQRSRGGFNFKDGIRDVKHLGDCQKSVKEFCELLGWADDLEKLISTFKLPDMPTKQ